MLATFEIGFVYWANKELENAINDAARLVRTGQAQAANMSRAELKAEACKHVAILVDCNTRMRLDVRSGASFSDITPPEAKRRNWRAQSRQRFQPTRRELLTRSSW